jgi:hypothetical protein
MVCFRHIGLIVNGLRTVTTNIMTCNNNNNNTNVGIYLVNGKVFCLFSWL